MKMRGTGLMILPSKLTTMATSKMEKEATDRPNPMRVTRKNGKSPKVQPLIYPPMYVHVSKLGSGEPDDR